MLRTFLHLFASLFSCDHPRTTFPITPRKSGRTYVCCLDCGSELAYDWKRMKLCDEIARDGVVSGVCIHTEGKS